MFIAEREGFEPPVQLPVHRISSAARSTTPASLQYVRTLSVHLPFGLSASAFPVHPNPTASRTISRALGLTVCKDKNFYFMLEHVEGLFLILIPKMARILSFAR